MFLRRPGAVLLEAGADPHPCDLKGNASFSLAAEHNPNPEVALRLLMAGPVPGVP